MTRPVRILSVLHKLHFGGHENRLLSLARTIDRRRFEHSLAVLGTAARDSAGGSMIDEFRAAGVDVIELAVPGHNAVSRPYRWWKLPAAGMFGTRAVCSLLRLIRERNIDVVDMHHTLARLTGVLAARLGRRAGVVTEYHPPLVLQAAGRLSLGAADAIVTDSVARAAEIQQWLRRSQPEVTVIRNGIRPPQPTKSAKAARTALGLPSDDDSLVIGQISALIPIKGHLVLLEAFRRVLDRRSNCRLLCVGFHRGHRDHENLLRRRSIELGIADQAIISGYAGEIGDVWQLIDIHVHASLFDSLPNAIIEGMSLGKPAVVTAVGGIPEVVTHNETGLLAPPNDAEALSNALLELIDDRNLAQRLGTSAYRRYRERLQPEVMTRALEELFWKLAEDRRRVVSQPLHPNATPLRRVA